MLELQKRFQRWQYIGGIGVTELIIILAILTLIFGAKKIPELARGMGQAIREFKKGVREEDGKEEEGGESGKEGEGRENLESSEKKS